MNIKTLSHGLFSLAILTALIYIGAFQTQQTTYASTVCAATCDYVTIQDAINAAVPDEGIEVQGTYNPATGPEGASIWVTERVDIFCTGGATIGNGTDQHDITYSVAGAKLRNCNLELMKVYVQDDTIEISGNTFTNDTALMNVGINISDGSGAQILNNDGLNFIYADGATVDGTDITGNTIEVNHDLDNGIKVYNGASNITIEDNTITSYVIDATFGFLISVNGASSNNVDIIGNTIRYAENPLETESLEMTTINGGSNHDFTGNYIIGPAGMTSGGIWAFRIWATDPVTNATVENNTIINNGANTFTGIEVGDSDVGDNISATVQYNLLYSTTSGSNAIGMQIHSPRNPPNTITVTENYNGVYNFNENFQLAEESVTSGGNSIEINPVLMDSNANGIIDSILECRPYSASCYFDADGYKDIGAYGDPSGEDFTRTVINVDDVGTIDYSSIDFNDLQLALDAACSAITDIDVAAGGYNGPINITDIDGLNINGAGSESSFLDAGGQTYGFNLSNFDNGEISGFSISGDTSTQSAIFFSDGSDNNFFTDFVLKGIPESTTTYIATRHPYRYEGNDYHFTGGGYGTIFVYGTGGFDYGGVLEDNADANSFISGEDWNLALGKWDDGGAVYLTFFVDNEDFNNPEDFYTWLDEDINDDGGGGGLSGIKQIDCWVYNVFDYEGGAYIYNAPQGGTSDCPGAAPTFTTSAQSSPSTPAIYVSQTAALQFHSSNNNTITNSRIGSGDLPNEYGVSFSGNSADNTIGSGMTWESNTAGDIYTSSTGDNTVTTDDFCELPFVYLVANTGKLLGCNSAPTITSLNASQASGANTVDITVTIDDPDNDELSLQVQYDNTPPYDSCDGEWAIATIDSVISPLDTLNGSSDLSFAWSAVSDICDSNGCEDGAHCLRIVATDDDNVTTEATKAVNFAYATPPAEPGGGGAIGAFLSGNISRAAEPSTTPDDISDEPTDEPSDEPDEPAETSDEPTDEPSDEPDLPNDVVVEFVEDLFTGEEPPPPPPPAPPAPAPEATDESTEDESEGEQSEEISESEAKDLIDEYLDQKSTEEPKEIPNVAESLSSGGVSGIIEDNQEYIDELLDEVETEEEKEDLKETIENLDITSDNDGDGVPDILELAYKSSILEDSSDAFFCGKNEDSQGVTSQVDGLTTGEEVLIRICSEKNEFLELFKAVDGEFEKVSDYEIQIDEAGWATVEAVLEGGEYFGLTRSREVAFSFEVNPEEVPPPPTLELAYRTELSGDPNDLTVGNYVGRIIELAGNSSGRFVASELIESRAIAQLTTKTPYLIGQAEPNQVAFITFSSRIVSSTVIADANGVIEAEFPQIILDDYIAYDIEGLKNHSFLAYVQRDNFLSNVARLIP